MKKLMIAIGAAATALGLYAAEPNVTGKASFEEAEPEVSGTEFTPSAKWTWTGTSALTLGTYTDTVSEYPTDAYPYNKVSGDVRRTDAFTGTTDQANYLKLETTKSEVLSHEITGDSIFVDQLVQFTGFEEAPDVDGAKIAVWMSEFVTSEENEEPETTSTNLFVTLGSEASGEFAPVSYQIAGTYKIGEWYRLTIKKVDITDQRAGFVVYINGQLVALDTNVPTGEAAQFVSPYGDQTQWTAAAKGFATDNQLFPAISEGSIASVGYNGIGAIDDITIDDQGPEFARFVDVTAAQLAITGAKVVKIDGVDVTGEGPWSVKPGDIVVTYAANGAYVLKGDALTATWTVPVTGTEPKSQDFEVKPAVAQIGTEYFETLAATFAKIQELEQAEAEPIVVNVLKACDATIGGTFVGFYGETTITIQDGGIWTVDGDIDFMGNIGSEGLAKSATVSGELFFSGTVTAGSTLKAETIITDDDPEIVLEEGASVITKTDISGILAEAKDGYDIVPGTGDLDGWTIYSLKAAPVETGFAIIIAGDDETTTNYYETLDLAIAAAGTVDPVKGPLPSVVTLLDDATLDNEVEIHKDVTIDLNGFTATFTDPTKDGFHFWNTAAGIIKNGTVTTTFASKSGCSLVYFTDASGSVEDLVVHAENCAWGVTTDSYPWGDPTVMAVAPTATVACKNVKVTGERNLFNFEYAKVSLDANCAATQTGTGTPESNYAAIALGWKAELTINGGDYSAENFVISKNSSPATLTINGGQFTGKFQNYGVDTAYTQYGADNLAIAGGKFTDNTIPTDLIALTPDSGYEKAWVDADTQGYVTPGQKAISYTITYAYTLDGVAVTDAAELAKIDNKNATSFTVENEDITLTAPTYDGYEFVSIAPEKIECSKTFDDVTVTVAFKTAEPDFPLDPDDDKLDENGEVNKATAKEVFGADLDAYVAAVYGTGKGIPASKLNATSEELIQIAKEYNLPIMEAGKVAIEITESATANAFEFQIKDGDTAVSLAAAEAKILSMVEFTSDLGDSTKPFATATATDVEVAIKEDNKTATATFKKATAAGFMRVNLKATK